MRATKRSALVFSAACVAAMLVGVLVPATARGAAYTKLRKFNPSGSLAVQKLIGGFDTKGIAVDAPGHVFLASSDNKIRKFTSGAVYLNYKALTGVSDVDIDAAGNIWAAVSTTNAPRIWEFNNAGAAVRNWNPLTTPGVPLWTLTRTHAWCVNVDQQGYPWVVFSGQYDGIHSDFVVGRFRQDGRRLSAAWYPEDRPVWDTTGHWDSVTVNGIATTSAWAWTSTSRFFAELDDIMAISRTAPTTAPLSRTFATPVGATAIASDASGYLYVTCANGRLYKYNQSGGLVRSWATGIAAPSAVEIGPGGVIWVAGK